MKRLRRLRSLLLLLATACTGDESVWAYGGADTLWQLHSIDGENNVTAASLTFPKPGALAGKIACLSYRGAQTAPYPWFSVERLAVTPEACAGHAAETAFVRALQDMTQAEVAGSVLILSNDDGREMLFKSDG